MQEYYCDVFTPHVLTLAITQFCTLAAALKLYSILAPYQFLDLQHEKLAKIANISVVLIAIGIPISDYLIFGHACNIRNVKSILLMEVRHEFNNTTLPISFLQIEASIKITQICIQALGGICFVTMCIVQILGYRERLKLRSKFPSLLQRMKLMKSRNEGIAYRVDETEMTKDDTSQKMSPSVATTPFAIPTVTKFVQVICINVY